MLGIPGEKSGRPSIKDMEKEITDKLRNQKLREERIRSDVSVPGVSDTCVMSWFFGIDADLFQVRQRPDTRPDTRQATPGWGPPTKQQVQPSLSERLREQDILNRRANEDDGW
jgi:hypothetical protein